MVVTRKRNKLVRSVGPDLPNGINIPKEVEEAINGTLANDARLKFQEILDRRYNEKLPKPGECYIIEFEESQLYGTGNTWLRYPSIVRGDKEVTVKVFKGAGDSKVFVYGDGGSKAGEDMPLTSHRLVGELKELLRQFDGYPSNLDEATEEKMIHYIVRGSDPQRSDRIVTLDSVFVGGTRDDSKPRARVSAGATERLSDEVDPSLLARLRGERGAMIAEDTTEPEEIETSIEPHRKEEDMAELPPEREAPMVELEKMLNLVQWKRLKAGRRDVSEDRRIFIEEEEISFRRADTGVGYIESASLLTNDRGAHPPSITVALGDEPPEDEQEAKAWMMERIIAYCYPGGAPPRAFPLFTYETSDKFHELIRQGFDVSKSTVGWAYFRIFLFDENPRNLIERIEKEAKERKSKKAKIPPESKPPREDESKNSLNRQAADAAERIRALRRKIALRT